MELEQAKTRLNKVFQRVFDDSALQIAEHMTAKDVPGWDSLTHIDLIVSVESEFAIKLTTREVMTLNNVGELLAIVVKKAPQ